jgi:hypothetical protein
MRSTSVVVDRAVEAARPSCPPVPGEMGGRSPRSSAPGSRADGSSPSSPWLDRRDVPPEVALWVSAGREALAVADHADQWDAGTRRAVLGELDRVAAIAVSMRAKIVTAERHAGTWSLRGDRDLAGFLGRESHQGRGAGFAVVGQAETLAAMPAVAEALVDGPVTPRHLDELARASVASPKLAEQLVTPEGQAQVLELARRFDGSDFGRRLKAMSASVDPATRQHQHDEQRANRFLNVSHTSGGALVRGRLDSVAGYKFQKMLDAFSPRPAADDERSREQRQADALMVAVDRALADRATTPGAHAPVEAIVTITQETWAALRAARESFDEAAGTGSAAGAIVALAAVDPVLDETGAPWPASEVARALCDCALTRAVVDAFGQVLDLGRGERLFQRQHWLALLAAGITTCAWPGCGMPLRYTELHHLAWWDRDGGTTSLANCAPYCSFHHHEIHRRDVRITRAADGTYQHRRPDGRLIDDGRLHDEPRAPLRSDQHRPPDALAPPGVGGSAGPPGDGDSEGPPGDLLSLLTA